jgi:PAS domain S-box-containing protein
MAPHEWEWTGPDGHIYDVYDFPFTDSDGSTLILEMGIDITERKRAEEALRVVHQYNRSLIEASLDPLVTINPEGKVTDVNSATELATGVSREQLIGSDFSDYFTEPEKAREGYRTAFLKGTVRDYPLAIRHRSGMITDVLYNATIYRNEAGEIQGILAAARDITETKEIQKRIEATNMLLSLFVKKLVRREYLDSVIELIQLWSGCRCVGIRILNEKDYIPYESYVGFNQEFWESENLLSVKYDQCACIRVVVGNPDPQDRAVMTPAGSFRCENTFEFVGSLSDEEKTRFRGVCIKNGFKSVAIVPIRYRDKILGGIHIADENEGKVPMSRVQFIEFMAPLIGEAINRFNLEEELKDSETRLRYLSSQLLTAQESERKRIAMELHDGIGQLLTAIKFKAESILQEKEKTRAKVKSLEAVIPMIKETIEEVRRMQMDLHPSTLDDLGVLATLGWFCREYQKIYSRIRIEKEIAVQENEVSAPLKVVLYRLTQEAMNNIAKHSQADLVHLSLRKQENHIEWIVEDNGTGFDLEKILSSERSERGLGLSSMRERAELSGGTFTIESTPGKGTTLKAAWPL